MVVLATGGADAEQPPVSGDSKNVTVEQLQDIFGAQQERDK